MTLDFPGDIVVTWHSTFSNRHYGLGEHFLGSDGTVDHGWAESDMASGEDREWLDYYPEKVNRANGTTLTTATARPESHGQLD